MNPVDPTKLPSWKDLLQPLEKSGAESSNDWKEMK